MVVRITQHNKDFFDEFPNSKYVHHWNGGIAYKAERDNDYILWIDEREVLDLIEINIFDEDFLSKDLITLYVFDSEKERNGYIEDLKFLKKSPTKKTFFLVKLFNKISNVFRKNNE